MKSRSLNGARAFLSALVFCAFVLVERTDATAQIEGISRDQIDLIREGANSDSAEQDTDFGSTEPQKQAFEGVSVPELPSRLEIFYTNRAGEPLLQFGYETFGVGRDIILRKMGGVQDNYVIGVGDTISIDLRGQENRSFHLKVDNVGRIILPKLDPITAAGRKFGDFRQQLERRIEDAYIATNVFASIDEVRQVSVLMSGEIHNPGPMTLSGLSTSVDALFLAGGIKKTGSLRDIKVYRGTEIINIDLYSILLGSEESSDFSLMEGDRIHVAPMGAAVAVAGWVKRPGIYELSGQQSVLTAEDVISLAGGYEVKGPNSHSLMQVNNEGRVSVVDVVPSRTRVREGDLLLVEPSDERARGAIRLEGHVRQRGTIALTQAKTLKSLLGEGEVFGSSVYMPFALITRVSTSSKLKTYVPFSPVDVIYGDADFVLAEDDVIRIFSLEEVRAISSFLANEMNEQDLDSNTLYPASDFGARKLEGIIEGKARSMRGRGVGGSAIVEVESNGTLHDGEGTSVSARDLLHSALGEMDLELEFDFSDPVLLSFFRESRISFYGAVKAPGDYFVVPGISLGQALEVAGGTAIQADLSAVEVTSTRFDHALGTSTTNRRVVPLNPVTLESIKLAPLDVIRVRRVFSNRISGSVEIAGEVKYPGRFDLMRGERLSNLIQRAGGMTSTAYPYGAVFTRVSAAVTEKKARERLVDQMESQLSNGVALGDMNADGAAFLANLIVRLREAPTLGRISIEADPAVLVASSKKDILLEPGDVLVIPPRPNSVTVTGEVLSPASYGFDANIDGGGYIKLAGGYAQFADKKRVFLILPDGQSMRLSEGRWKFGEKMVAPGAVVVVPRNLRPFQWEEMFLSITQISSQLALTAASVSVIGNK